MEGWSGAPLAMLTTYVKRSGQGLILAQMQMRCRVTHRLRRVPTSAHALPAIVEQKRAQRVRTNSIHAPFPGTVPCVALCAASVSSRVAQEVAQALKARAAAAAAAAPGTHGSDAFALMDPHEVNYWCRY